jgi:acyl transferase domain-containing protein
MGHAFHSRQMEPLREPLARALRDLRLRPRTAPIVSSLLGRAVEGGELGAEYWSRGTRERVRFAEAVEALAGEGYGAFLEIGPHPVLAPMIVRCAAGRDWFVRGSLRRGQPERKELLESLGGLFRLGAPVDFARCGPDGGRAVPLPRYPWQRSRHWLDLEARP